MSMINVSNLTFSYNNSYNNIFENVFFKIDTDWKIGFIGRNGKGKTTFFNLLLKKYEYSGTISSNVNFEYFPFKINDDSLFTIDIIKEKSLIDDNEYWKIQKELNLLELNDDILYRPFKTLSGGEQVKVLLISLFLKTHCFLLIDEPTNHLDINAKEIVTNYLNSKKGFILVSHNRKLLDSCVDHILSINKTDIELQTGNFSSWYNNKKMKENCELAENKKLKKDINRLEKSAKITENWSNKIEKTKNGSLNSGLKPDKGYIGHQSAKMMRRSKSIQKRQQSAIEEKSNLLKNVENIDSLKITCLEHHVKNLLNFKNISLFYGNKKIFENINLEIKNGDRIALCGKNGCGKSTILKFINGDNSIKFTGNFNKANNLKISYLPQNTDHLNGALSDFATDNNIDETLFKTILRKLDFSRVQFEKSIENFSEGQKKKVLIAKSLCEQAHIYLWDEPLNFIDIFSIIQIEELILKFNPTILFIEHDETFTKNIATQIINL